MGRVIGAVAAVLLFASVAFAETQCQDYPNPQNKPTPVLRKKGVNASIQVDILTGSGSVGSYQLQESNTGLDNGWVNLGSAVATEALSKETAAASQFIRAVATVTPAVGTTVRVCIWADGVSEQ